jgi:hypothetical protein
MDLGANNLNTKVDSNHVGIFWEKEWGLGEGLALFPEHHFAPIQETWFSCIDAYGDLGVFSLYVIID